MLQDNKRRNPTIASSAVHSREEENKARLKKNPLRKADFGPQRINYRQRMKQQHEHYSYLPDAV